MPTASPQTQLKEGTQSPNLHVLWKRQLGFSGEQTSFKKAVSVSFLPGDWAAQGLMVTAVHGFVHCSSLSYCFGFACKVRVKQEKKREQTSTLQKPVSCRMKTGRNHTLSLLQWNAVQYTARDALISTWLVFSQITQCCLGLNRSDHVLFLFVFLLKLVLVFQ